MKLKTVITFLYLLLSIPLFLFFHENIFVWLSFFINYLVITYITYYHINIEKTYSPFLSSYIVFSFLFFTVAPIMQIKAIQQKGLTFINNFPYNKIDIIYSNLLILLFSIIFFLSYVLLKKKSIIKKKEDLTKNNNAFTALLVLLLFVLSLIIVFANYTFIIEDIKQPVYFGIKQSVFSLLIKKKVLFLIPFGAIVIAYRYLKNKKKVTTNTFIIFFVFLALMSILLLLKNPLIEKRNALGPIYICLIYLFYPKIINSNVKTFTFLFFSMVLLFPLISAFTHINSTFDEMLSNPQLILNRLAKNGVLETFNTLNYDAFANIMATVEYVDKDGYSYGYQLLSALLFFIPRSVWQSKPISTGELIGNHLIDTHSFNFSNLSNPIISEGYVNFGVFGVFLMAVILAVTIVKFLKWLNSNDVLKEIIAFYFAIHLIFLLRGDFTNGFVYFIGTLIGTLIIPKVILSILNIYYRK